MGECGCDLTSGAHCNEHGPYKAFCDLCEVWVDRNPHTSPNGTVHHMCLADAAAKRYETPEAIAWRERAIASLVDTRGGPIDEELAVAMFDAGRAYEKRETT